MLRQGERGVKDCEVTHEALTSVEPMERETGKAKAQPEEDITMEAGTFDSDGNERSNPQDESYGTSQIFVYCILLRLSANGDDQEERAQTEPRLEKEQR